MTYKVIRRDLTETTRKCDFCPRYLISLKAYVLENVETNELFYAGPKCAKNNVGDNSLFGVPDLTKFTMATGNREDSSIDGRGSTDINNRQRKAIEERKAIEYLMLRENKLVNELNCSYSVLREYYQKSKIQKLSESDIIHINNIAYKAPEHLTLSVLQKIYNYLFWIDVGIAKLDSGKTDFLVNVRRTIVSKRKITEGQKLAINRWLENIDGVPQLR
ncbi:hypothetical protein ES754_11650 [Psychrobacter frigidicola]|uniref:Uncharacterized protein n=1 Tax=Psychrobacter frigidicola TaxID=45611 RepID=A0A5C6ZZ05_9GAMM|nr:hypothetical protein [Psychrobacter frigidicola]TXD96277.1 hypothetical protein ES754_11650 [Psychrobacter frigidicola]